MGYKVIETETLVGYINYYTLDSGRKTLILEYSLESNEDDFDDIEYLKETFGEIEILDKANIWE